MDLIVERDPDGGHVLVAGGRRVACAIGRGGIVRDKREGDGGTPVGAWPLRRVLYRPDRVPPPVTGLPVAPIAPDDGWCDDPAHPLYNRPVKRPFAASHEEMWRDDHVYDLVVVLGHNDDPPVPGLGSAVFLHLSRAPDLGPDGRDPGGGSRFAPTAGCVAVPLAALQDILALCAPGDRLIVPA